MIIVSIIAINRRHPPIHSAAVVQFLFSFLFLFFVFNSIIEETNRGKRYPVQCGYGDQTRHKVSSSYHARLFGLVSTVWYGVAAVVVVGHEIISLNFDDLCMNH